MVVSWVVLVRIRVPDRVHGRRPGLCGEDVAAAFRSVMTDAERVDGTWMAIGLDSHGRDVELLYKMIGEDVLVYHASGPPTRKSVRRTGRLRRGR